MLEKKAGGNFNVEKLCIILLFKGNFNQNNKWLGWVVIFNAKFTNKWQKNSIEELADIQCLNKGYSTIMHTILTNHWPYAPTTQKVAMIASYLSSWPCACAA